MTGAASGIGLETSPTKPGGRGHMEAVGPSQQHGIAAHCRPLQARRHNQQRFLGVRSRRMIRDLGPVEVEELSEPA